MGAMTLQAAIPHPARYRLMLVGERTNFIGMALHTHLFIPARPFYGRFAGVYLMAVGAAEASFYHRMARVEVELVRFTGVAGTAESVFLPFQEAR